MKIRFYDLREMVLANISRQNVKKVKIELLAERLFVAWE